MMFDKTTNKHALFSAPPVITIKLQWTFSLVAGAKIMFCWFVYMNSDWHSKFTSFTLLTRKYFRLTCVVCSAADRHQYTAQYGPDAISYVWSPSLHISVRTGRPVIRLIALVAYLSSDRTSSHTSDRPRYISQFGPDVLSYVWSPAVHSWMQSGHCCRDYQSCFSWGVAVFGTVPHCHKSVLDICWFLQPIKTDTMTVNDTMTQQLSHTFQITIQHSIQYNFCHLL